MRDRLLVFEEVIHRLTPFDVEEASQASKEDILNKNQSAEFPCF